MSDDKSSDFIDDIYSSKSTNFHLKLPAEKKRSKIAKNMIGNLEGFRRSREILGNIIVEGMKTSGGTDVDWLVERRGNFIILEIKTFNDDRIHIPLGQMIAYENLHEKLNSNGKCYLYIIGVEENDDFTDDNDPVWKFEIYAWNKNIIPHNTTQWFDDDVGRKRESYFVEREFMDKITVSELRELIESAWNEFSEK